MNKKEERDDYVFMQSVCQKRCLFDVSFPFLLFTFKLWHWGQREYEHLQKALFLHLSLLYLRLLNVLHPNWSISHFIVLHNYFIIRNNIMQNMFNIEIFFNIWLFNVLLLMIVLAKMSMLFNYYQDSIEFIKTEVHPGKGKWKSVQN